jgi:hypothetical protein
MSGLDSRRAFSEPFNSHFDQIRLAICGVVRGAIPLVLGLFSGCVSHPPWPLSARLRLVTLVGVVACHSCGILPGCIPLLVEWCRSATSIQSTHTPNQQAHGLYLTWQAPQGPHLPSSSRSRIYIVTTRSTASRCQTTTHIRFCKSS